VSGTSKVLNNFSSDSEKGLKKRKKSKKSIQNCTINPGNPNISQETIEILSAGNPDGSTEYSRLRKFLKFE
jgi:hypothetical protein